MIWLLLLVDLPVGMAWRCFFLDACLVVVVAGSGDVLELDPFLACHAEENWFLRHAAVFSDALFGEPASLSVPTIASRLHGRGLGNVARRIRPLCS